MWLDNVFFVDLMGLSWGRGVDGDLNNGNIFSPVFALLYTGYNEYVNKETI